MENDRKDFVPRLRLRLRLFLRWLLRLRGSPEAIAGGAAVGVLVAFTPTIGFQMVLAVGIATLLNVNRPIAIVPTWLTNPITIPPVYAFTYYIGSFFWPGPVVAEATRAMAEAAREMASLDLLAVGAQFEVLFGLGVNIFVPMWIGGILVGGVAAAITYPLTKKSVIELRRRRSQQRIRRARRRSERNSRKRRSSEGRGAPADSAGPGL